MDLVVHSERARDLAEALAQRMGRSVSEVVEAALEEKLATVPPAAPKLTPEEKMRRIDEILKRSGPTPARRHQRPLGPLRRGRVARLIVDASALLAVLLDEAEGTTFKRFIAERAGPHHMSPVNYLEIASRLNRLRLPAKSAELDPLMNVLSITVTTVTAKQATLARQAQERFGKGNHPAKLNLGDCFAYALAKARGEPLLFKGDDFRQTDIEAAL